MRRLFEATGRHGVPTGRSRESYSLEFKGGGVFYFKTIIDNLDDNS